jgi:predicted alpha-1,2-mannosidase
MRARDASGNWMPVGDPRDIGQAHCTEGSAWQWTWFAPHDVAGLIELAGSREAFVRRLDKFFGENLYSHGNEPDLHVAYLYNYAGAPWKTQQQVRKIIAGPVTSLYGTHGYLRQPVVGNLYNAAPEGFLIEMDDDCGTMSAWYVFSAMGFYPVCPGSDRYAIGSPLFERVVVRLDERHHRGKQFVIIAQGVSRENQFIQSATLNGRALNRAWITHAEIVNGGGLKLVMGPTPAREWARDE